MYQRILLCYDGTIEGRRALRQGADVAIAMNSHAYLLAICRDLVDLMGGQLDAVSTPGAGSTFTAVLPLARVPD